MSTFATRTEGRIHVHILPHSRFRTKDLMIRLHTPLRRENVTAIALLPYMWMNGTVLRPSTQALMTAADDLYGTVLRTSLGKRGDFHILEAAASIPDVSELTQEDVVQQAVELTGDLLLHHELGQGAFTEAAVAQEIDLHKRRIESARDDKMSFALQRCLAEVAEDSPSALPRLGFIEDLEKLTNQSLFEAYQSLFTTSEVHVYLVGPFEHADEHAQAITLRLSERFNRESSSRSTLQIEPLARQARQDFRTVQETQDVAQAQLDIGYRSGVNFSNDLYPSMLMMNGILGGFAHSKLFLNVREKHSLAYSVWSHHDSSTGVLAVMTGIDPNQYEKALQIIQEQVAAIQAGQITDEEMDFTYRGLENQYTVLLDQPSAMANWHYNGILCGKERDIPDILAALKKVTKEDVAKAAGVLQPHTIYFLTGEGDAS